MLLAIFSILMFYGLQFYELNILQNNKFSNVHKQGNHLLQFNFYLLKLIVGPKERKFMLFQIVYNRSVFFKKMQHTEFIILCIILMLIIKYIIIYYPKEMPRIELQYKGFKHQFQLSPQQTTKEFIQAEITKQWRLSFEEINLTYFDSDGDEISVDIQDDFDVARDTMITESDNLVFTVHLNEGVQPNFSNAKQINKDSQREVVESVDPKLSSKQNILHSCPQNTHQQGSKNLQIQKISQNSETQINGEPLQIQIKPENILPQKQVKVEGQKVNDKEAKEAKEAAKALKKAQDEQKKRMLKQQKQKAKLAADQKKKQAEIAKKLAKETKDAKQKQRKMKKQSKQKCESSGEQKLIQKEKKKQQTLKCKLKAQELTQEKVIQLIRSQVFNMLPQLRQKLLELPQKQQNKQPEVKKSGQKLLNSCSFCQKTLIVPFYYSPQNQGYLCSSCETKDTTKAILIKIRDENHLQNNFFTYAGVVNKQQLAEVEPQAYQKFIEEARNIAVGYVKQGLKKKLLAHRKQLAQQKKRSLNK